MSNPEFVAAENGSKFMFDGTGSDIGISIGEPPEYYLTFYRYGNAVTYPCGQQFGAVQTRLAVIGVTAEGGPNGTISSPSIMLNSTAQEPDINCPPYGLPISVTYPLNSIPRVFTIRNVTFSLVYNATGYSSTHNGTRTYNPGFTMLFNATKGIQWDSFLFFWPTSTPVGLPTSPFTGYEFPANMTWFLNGTEPYLNATLPFSYNDGGNNSISMSGFSLCASDCGAQSTLFTGSVSVHSTSPLYSLQLLVNGTVQERVLSQSVLTVYSLPYQAVLQSQVVKGSVYQIELVATFRDGSTSTTKALVTAE
jgi:hypothetical protein